MKNNEGVSGHTLYPALNQTHGNSGRGGGARETYIYKKKKKKRKKSFCFLEKDKFVHVFNIGDYCDNIFV